MILSHMYLGFHINCPLFLSDSDETWILNRLTKNSQISNFIKICSMGVVVVACGQTDRQTWHDNTNGHIAEFFKCT